MKLAPPDAASQLWLRIYAWLLRKGPRIVAHWLASAALTMQHTEGEAFCWPCEARKRIVADSHRHTVGPFANIYCPKCGLEKYEWKKWCKNRVVRVNNRAQKPRRHIMIGWD